MVPSLKIHPAGNLPPKKVEGEVGPLPQGPLSSMLLSKAEHRHIIRFFKRTWGGTGSVGTPPSNSADLPPLDMVIPPLHLSLPRSLEQLLRETIHHLATAADGGVGVSHLSPRGIAN
ncbi:hypothetical protein AVEN_118869-1 [Araneus ventricosus]|uniref:Uncharacterized protein n=1 Tax=Araneus ventricosus TaxID=182803 RepID=A0A4Y2MVC7_ARAVE|nr:hypothetical protein AVEN_118869-1 [Araneus ventricosus]